MLEGEEWIQGVIEDAPVRPPRRKRRAHGKLKEADVPEFHIQIRSAARSTSIRRSLDIDDFGVSWFTVVSKMTTTDCAYGGKCTNKDSLIFADGMNPPFVQDRRPHLCETCKEPGHNLCFQAYFKVALQTGKHTQGNFYCPDCGER